MLISRSLSSFACFIFIGFVELQENLEDQKHEELSRQTTKLAEEAQAELSAQAETGAQNATPADQTPSGRASTAKGDNAGTPTETASTAKGDNADTTPQVTAHPEAVEAEGPSRGSDRKGEQSEGEAVDPGDTTERPVSTSKEGEPELTKLLQQTDDAKVQCRVKLCSMINV